LKAANRRLRTETILLGLLRRIGSHHDGGTRGVAKPEGTAGMKRREWHAAHNVRVNRTAAAGHLGPD
jgi:hypothetical protein